jgi:carboxymethylenebutenolidase
MKRTDQYEGLLAETITLAGANGDLINAYLARPLGPGPYPAMVLAHHMPGWDEWYREATHRFAYHGYVTVTPNLYYRSGHGTPEDVAAKVRADGGIPDAQAVGDLAGAMQYLRSLPYTSGKVGIFGTCSGGRHAYLTACQVAGFDAIIDCWGGRVVMPAEQLNANFPVAPIDYTADLSCPILGLFGNDDTSPPPDQVDQHEAELKKHGTGHGFFYYNRPNYRQAQAVDGWEKIFNFLGKHLGG